MPFSHTVMALICFFKDFFAICGFSHTVLALFARFTPFLRQKCLFFAFSYAGDDFTAFCSFLRLFRLFGALFAFLGYLEHPIRRICLL